MARRQQMAPSISIGVMSASRLRYDLINAAAARRSKPIRGDSIRQMPLRPGTSCVGIQIDGDPTPLRCNEQSPPEPYKGSQRPAAVVLVNHHEMKPTRVAH